MTYLLASGQRGHTAVTLEICAILRPSLTHSGTKGGLAEAGLSVMPSFLGDEPVSV